MSELRAIARELVRASADSESVVVASVVRAEGATYRAVGARGIVRTDGTTIGILSGGCLEREILERAARVRESGVAELMSYDARSDDELVWGLGTGCNGLVEVLVERRDAKRAAAFGALLQLALEQATPSVMATVMRASGRGAPEVGARVLVHSGVSLDGDWGTSALLDAVIADASGAKASPRRGMTLDYTFAASDNLSLDESLSTQISFELVIPGTELIICGSGPDVIPIARLAASLGWNTVVVDHRPAALTAPGRFEGALVVECSHSESLGTVVAPTPRSAAIVMSHNYERDLDYLDALLRSEAKYVGVLGPRARTARLLKDLERRGRQYGEDSRARIHAPIGLDVGGDGAEAIALSIVAEVAAVMHGRTGTHLRDRDSTIHESRVFV